MIIIQRRVFDTTGRATPEIGFYDDADKLIGTLRDGEKKMQFDLPRVSHFLEQVFQERGLSIKKIRQQDKISRAAYAWGWPEPTGEEDYEDESI